MTRASRAASTKASKGRRCWTTPTSAPSPSALAQLRIRHLGLRLLAREQPGRQPRPAVEQHRAPDSLGPVAVAHLVEHEVEGGGAIDRQLELERATLEV